MTKLSLLLAAALLTGGVAYAHEGHDGHSEQSEGKSVRKTGEIVDLACYVGHESAGAKHGKCAKQCIKGGAPMGLKTESGDLWVLVNDHSSEAAYEAAKDLAGEKKVKVTGRPVQKGGLNALIVEKAVISD